MNKEQKKTREKWVGGGSCTRTQLHCEMNICVKTILVVRKMLNSNGNSDVESFWGNRWQALRSSGFYNLRSIRSLYCTELNTCKVYFV